MIYGLPVTGMWRQEFIQLVADYGTAVEAYRYSVAELERGLISESREVLRKHRRSAEEARAVCEAARKALDDYIAAHGGDG
jgi:hypothetical protein